MYDILQNNSGVNITISAGQLKEAIDYGFTKSWEAFMAQQKPEQYVSRNKTSQTLGVDLSTLWRWNKCGYLKPVSIGSKKMYLQSDIDNILKEGRLV
jgi:predicted DNA-binding transcriptional regulator AlpA